MLTCELREVALDDVDAVYALIGELKQKTYDRRHFAAGFAMNLQNPTLRYQLAEVNGAAVGLIGLQLQFPLNFNAWIGEVQELVVLPQMRGLRVGQALLAWAEQEARGRGAVMMELSSGKARPDAHRFYLREGYTHSHLRFKKAL
ncbi:TPA: aminoalkylphosphonate N-acetyltransferase [Raoultella planticola]